MKKLIYFASLASLFCVLPSCKPASKDEPLPEAGKTYPRVQLIEHFTGADCGYCPTGMDYIYEVYSAAPENYVWVSNHYGFGSDAYTISESATIGKALSVQGAPSISLNREQYTVDGSKARNYHPYYLSQLAPKTATTATSQIQLATSYDSASGKLTIKVTGETSDAELQGVMLTVGVTESGMQGKQKDYVSTFEGWKKFTHTHTIRAYATAALGDAIEFSKQRFTQEYTIDMASSWVAENCQVVAWITAIDTKYPVLNAAKTPVVEGSKGGEDIKHGGVELMPVDATYPESGSPAQSFTFDVCQAQYMAADGYTLFALAAMSNTAAAQDSQVGGLYPYLDATIVVAGNVTALPVGTYNLSTNPNIGDAVAGYRDDENVEIGGTQLYYVYSYNNSLYIGAQWLLVSGSIQVTETGFSLSATTLNGSSFTASFTGQIPCSAYQSSAPKYAVMQSYADEMAAERSRRFLLVK